MLNKGDDNLVSIEELLKEQEEKERLWKAFAESGGYFDPDC